MTFEDAVRKSIQAYFEGGGLDAYNKTTQKKSKYTKKYFDKVGEEYGIEPFDPKNTKKKSGK